jgi:lysozyme
MPSPARRTLSYAVIAAALIAPLEGYWPTVKPDRLAYNLPTGGFGTTTHDRPLKIGETHTRAEWMGILVEDIPKYKKPLEKCVHVELTQHQWAALTSGAYNAGSAAMCKSPMVRAFNRHDPHACDYFRGWYVRAGGRYVRGLANRREKERAICLMKD